jgi:hypothetical protein
VEKSQLTSTPYVRKHFLKNLAMLIAEIPESSPGILSSLESNPGILSIEKDSVVSVDEDEEDTKSDDSEDEEPEEFIML